MAGPVPTSIILLVDRDGDAPPALVTNLEHALGDVGTLMEVVVAISDRAPATRSEFERQRAADPRLHLLFLSHWFDAAAAVQRALPLTDGAVVVTMRPQDLADRDRLPDLIQGLAGAEIAALTPAAGGALAGRIDRLHERFTQRVFGTSFAVVPSSMRAHRRPVLVAIADRSVPFALGPLLAAWRGGRVATLPRSRRSGRVPLGKTVGHALATPLLYFLLSFIRRPLHLFGLVGMVSGLIGALITLPLITDRLIHEVPLADEPALIPGLLLLAVGVQSTAIGLLAELLVFVRARSLKDDSDARLVH